MTNRGSQTLTYDAQNQLVRSATTNDTVLFGYDNTGKRLFRAGTNGYAVWIGGIYEINDEKMLCRVYAGGLACGQTGLRRGDIGRERRQQRRGGLRAGRGVQRLRRRGALARAAI